MKQLLFTVMLLFFMGSLAMSKSDLPNFYKDFRLPNHKQSLDYILVKINGAVKLVRNGETISFVGGDIVEITAGHLNDTSSDISAINVYGYRSPKGGLDDRFSIIDTANSLDKATWATDKKSLKFSVLASSRRLLHGVIYLERRDPKLSYVEVKVNNKTHLMRQGQNFVVSGSDKFKVEKVVTNIDDVENIEFSMIELPMNPIIQDQNGKKYSIVLRYKNNVFARLPMTVRNE